MKKIILLLAIMMFFCSGTDTAHAQKYTVTDFENSDKSLKNHNPPFADNDIVEIEKNLDATSDIGSLGDIKLTIIGNGFIIDGRSQYSGFELQGDSAAYTFNGVTMQNFYVTSNTDIAKGSAIINGNKGSLNILDSSFLHNSAISSLGATGGAIFSQGATTNTAPAIAVTITNSLFFSNLAENPDSTSNKKVQGGAIYNAGKTNFSVTDSTFKNNTAKAEKYSQGGAISNETTLTGSQININNCVFDGNSAISITDTAYGGAIHNNAATELNSVINDSVFFNNIAQGRFGRGGAVFNAANASIAINNSVFEGNLVIGEHNSTGGAIDNSSSNTTVIRNCIFENNSVMTKNSPKGGAIYNSKQAVLNLIADEGYMKFSGNTSGIAYDKQVSNAIYSDENSILHFNTSKSGMFYMGDRMDAINKTAVININMNGAADKKTPIENAPVNGTVIFMDTIKNYTLNLYNGTMQLGKTGSNIITDGSYFSGVDLNLKGGILNTANSNIDDLKLDNLTSTTDAKLYLDANLSGTGSIDNFTVGTSASGKIEIIGINILNDSDTDKTLTLFKGPNTLDLSAVGLNVYTNTHKYTVQSGTSGTLDFTVEAISYGLNGAINDTEKYRSFSFTDDVDVTLSLGNMQGGADSVLTLFGNGKSLNGNRNEGLTISDGQTLRILSAGAVDSSFQVETAVNGFIKAGPIDMSGGFLENNGTSDIYSAVFMSNQVVSTEAGKTASGGAVSNTKDLSLSYTVFNNNKAISIDTAKGGALHNTGKSSVIYSRFENNTTLSYDGEARGGALNNEGEMTLVNVAFMNNTAQGETAKGGAIYNSGILSIIASAEDLEFTGNTANGISEAIYNKGTLNLNTGRENKIIFNDSIKGEDKTSSLININLSDNTAISRPSHGELILNNKITDSTISFGAGTLTPTKENYLDGNNFNFKGGFLNYLNNEIGTTAFDTVTLSGSTRWGIDVDLAGMTGDRITAENVLNPDGTINITAINLLTDATKDSIKIPIVSDNLKNNIELSVARAYTPIYQYQFDYDSSTGNLIIGGGPYSPDPVKKFNPAILAAPVAAQVGSYLAQLNSYEEAFNNMDMNMLMTKEQRTALKFRNKVAASSSSDTFYSPLMTRYKDEGIWFKPYTTFENVPLKNGPRVSNVSYGGLAGVDSSLKELGHGWEGIYSLYAGYNGSHQAYQGVGIYQNGGLAGMSGVLYKGNFFTGLTVNAGANSGEASTMYGRDNFTMFTAGIASKTGYNFELLNSRLILQPNYLMSYTFVNTFDYTNAAGVRLHSSPLNAIQIAPGLKIIGNLKNGWQPYIGLSMIWNIIDDTKFKANDVWLPEMSIDPYFQYGVGLQKIMGERFTGFSQIMFRNGGRNGVSLQFGFRLSI